MNMCVKAELTDFTHQSVSMSLLENALTNVIRQQLKSANRMQH